MSLLLDLMAGEAAVGYYVFLLIVYILLVIAWWRMFEKAGQPGWASLIPIYNTYVLYKISWGNGWLFLLQIIPVVNVIVDIVMKVKLSKAFGYSGAFALGLIFLPNIFQLILGFGGSRYIGPEGKPVQQLQ